MVLTLSEYSHGNAEETFVSGDFAKEAFTRLQRLRRQGKMCDIVLMVGNSKFSAHRVVLASTIPYFTSMLTSDMSETTQREIIIHGIEDHALESLINFAYSCELTVDINTVQSIMMGANFLQLQVVKDFCCTFIEKHINPNNSLGVRSFGEMMMCSQLIEAATSYLHQHFVEVAKSDEFFALPKHEVIYILSKNELNVTSEEQVFHAASNWVRHQFADRADSMHELLQQVRLPLLKPQFLTDVVQMDVACKGCLRCRDLVDKAKDYHLMPDRRADFAQNLVRPRYCANIKGHIYAVGGLTSACDALNTVEKYAPFTDRWEIVASMHTCRSRVGVAVLAGQLYAAGGYDGTNRLDTVEMYMPDVDEWCFIKPMSARRSALGCTAHDDQIFACGGYDGVVSLSSCEVYQPHTQVWHAISDMNKARSAVAVVSFHGAVYVLGGHDGLSIFNSVERYDPLTDKWHMKVPMLTKRCRHGVVALRGSMYAFGGYDGREFLNTGEAFDHATDQWSHLAPMEMRRSRVGMAVSGGRIYCLGGYDGSSNLKSVEVYDPEADAWTASEHMIGHDGGVGVGTIVPMC